MYFSSARLVLLVLIAMVIGINILVLVNDWRESVSTVNPLLNIGGLTLLGVFVLLHQWSQNRKLKQNRSENHDA